MWHTVKSASPPPPRGHLRGLANGLVQVHSSVHAFSIFFWSETEKTLGLSLK